MIIFQTNQSQGLVWKRSDGHIYNLHAAGNRCSNCPMSALVTSSNGLGPACLLSLGSKTLPQDKIGLEIEARDVQVTTLLGPGLVSHLIGWYWASQDNLERGYPTSRPACMNRMKTTMVSRRYQMVMVVGEGNVIIALHDEDWRQDFLWQLLMWWQWKDKGHSQQFRAPISPLMMMVLW